MLNLGQRPGCGIDIDEASPAARASPPHHRRPGPAPARVTGPRTSGTGQRQRGNRRRRKLLTVEGPGRRTGIRFNRLAAPAPAPADVAEGAHRDHAQAVFAHSGTRPVCSRPSASTRPWTRGTEATVASFSSDLQSCDNPLVDVSDLDVRTSRGDEQVAARSLVGGQSRSGLLVDLGCVRVGTAAVTVPAPTSTPGREGPRCHHHRPGRPPRSSDRPDPDHPASNHACVSHWAPPGRRPRGASRRFTT